MIIEKNFTSKRSTFLSNIKTYLAVSTISINPD